MSILCQDYSGISINQNAILTDWYETPNDTTLYQTFVLPINYVRGTLPSEQRIPDFSGIQVLVQIPEGLEDEAQITYSLGYQLPQGELQSNPFNSIVITSGTVIGTYTSGEVWFDLIFSESAPILQEWLDYTWVLELTFTGITGVAYVSPQTVVGGAYSQYTAQTQTVLASPSASLNFRLLSLSADSGIDFLGNQLRSMVVTTPPNNLSTTDDDIPLGGFADYYMSPALPSPNAVSSLYFDMRQQSGSNIYENINLVGNPSFEHDFPGYPPPYWTTLYGAATTPTLTVEKSNYAVSGVNALSFTSGGISNYNTVSLVSPTFPIGSSNYGAYTGLASYSLVTGTGNVTLQYDFFDDGSLVSTTGPGNQYIQNGHFQHDALNTAPYGWTQTAFSTFKVDDGLGTGYPALDTVVIPTTPSSAVATSNSYPVLGGACYPVGAYVNVFGATASHYLPSSWEVNLGITWYNSSNTVISSETVASTYFLGATNLVGYVQAPSNAVKAVTTVTVETIDLNTSGANSIETFIDLVFFGVNGYVDGDSPGYNWLGTAGESFSYKTVTTPTTLITNAPPNVDSMRICIDFNTNTSSTSSLVAWVDAICVEYTQSPTPVIPTYFDGDYSDCAWLGQYDNSFSAQVEPVSIIDEPVVIDALVFDPLTPNMSFNLYYSSDDSTNTDPMTETAWEQKLWFRVPQQFTANSSMITALPNPINAKYIKIELINPQPQSYLPNDIQLQVPYKTFPSWVQNYFQANTNYDAYVADQVVVQQNALTTLYLPNTTGLIQNPNLPPAVPTSASVTLPQGSLDNTTLSQINLETTPYQDNLGSTSTPDTVIGQIALTTANTFINGAQQVTEGTGATYTDISTVSSLQRDNVLAEQLTPNMYFFYTCRHAYMENYATFDNNKAYFFGVNAVTFLRSNHVVASNSSIYTESGGDSNNSLLNDFTITDTGTWIL